MYSAPEAHELGWAVVSVSRLEGKTRVVPLEAATFGDDGIHVSYSLAAILSAPQLASEGVPTQSGATELRAHYRPARKGGRGASGRAGNRRAADAAQREAEERRHISTLEWRPLQARADPDRRP